MSELDWKAYPPEESLEAATFPTLRQGGGASGEVVEGRARAYRNTMSESR